MGNCGFCYKLINTGLLYMMSLGLLIALAGTVSCDNGSSSIEFRSGYRLSWVIRGDASGIFDGIVYHEILDGEAGEVFTLEYIALNCSDDTAGQVRRFVQLEGGSDKIELQCLGVLGGEEFSRNMQLNFNKNHEHYIGDEWTDGFEPWLRAVGEDFSGVQKSFFSGINIIQQGKNPELNQDEIYNAILAEILVTSSLVHSDLDLYWIDLIEFEDGWAIIRYPKFNRSIGVVEYFTEDMGIVVYQFIEHGDDVDILHMLASAIR